MALRTVFVSVLVLGACVAAEPGTDAAAVPPWSLTTLGTLGGGDEDSSYATDVNDAGVVVGASTTARGEQHAFRWSNGELTDLGTLGGGWSEAVAINAAGDVVGNSTTSDGVEHGFFWHAGRIRDIGSLGANTQSVVTAVNGRGQVVGTSTTASGADHAFRWARGRLRDLGTLGGATSSASAINDAGQVAGVSETADGASMPFRWRSGVLTPIAVPWRRPGAPPRFDVTINGAGVVGGSVFGGGDSGSEDTVSRLFHWSGGAVTFAGRAVPNVYRVAAENERGDLAAYDYVCCVDESYGVVWQGPTLRKLTFAQEARPFDINDSGLVVGGTVYPGAPRLPFTWQRGRITILRGGEGEADAVNDAGTIVGSLQTGPSTRVAALWQR